MFAEYILAAMERATYEIIDDPEPYYGEVPELQGVWATGKTLEECRKELQSVIEGWIALKLRLGHPIPAIGGHVINYGRFIGILTIKNQFFAKLACGQH
jgi:predicted RNase H-like HicB family nuclease